LAKGEKHSLAEIRDMVCSDPKMQNPSESEKEFYLNKLKTHRALKNMSVHSSNVAAAKDVREMLDHIFEELDGLALRTGTYTCLFGTRGHVYDTSQATWFGTNNIMEFFEDVMHWEADEITQKLEQWACMHGSNLDERDSVENNQRICARLLTSGLHTSLTKNVRINFPNFKTNIKEKYRLDCVGWPEDTPFQAPSTIRDNDQLRKLWDALKSGTCHWKKMSPREHANHSAQLEARRKAGETVGKARKKRSDAGTTRKRNAGDKESAPHKKRQLGKGTAPKSSEFVDTSDEEDEGEDDIEDDE
ncbi:hypothetical protein HYDPIDRAFT_92480, partial [Hydnomerulius pinastri MD-312]